MTGKSRWARSNSKTGAISRWWSGALLAAGVAMTFGAASCGGSSGGPSFFGLGDGIWVADPTPNTTSETPQVDEFTTTQLRNGATSVIPRRAIQNPGTDAVPPFSEPLDTLFDSSGDLWVVDSGDDTGTPTIFEFTKSQLKGNGVIVPAFFLTSDSNFEFPTFAVFDSKGNLWVSDPEAEEILEFTAQQLTTTPPGGDQAPNLTLVDSTDELTGPIGMVFDAAGDLWVADNDDSILLEFKAATLASLVPGSNDVPADAVINPVTTTEDTASVSNPWGLSFDGSGNLWVTNETFTPDLGAISARAKPSKANAKTAAAQLQATSEPTAGAGTVVEFAAADLAAAVASPGSAPTPVAVIIPTAVNSNTTFSLVDPNGVSVDVKRGLLAVANAGDNGTPDDESAGMSVYKLSAIGSGGALVPNSFVVSNGTTTIGSPAGLIVGPAH